uniref:Uncharacterized protein n=1 Tax=Ciona intestinalis TaxID=7719 RepID=H2XYZ8_CIOIN
MSVFQLPPPHPCLCELTPQYPAHERWIYTRRLFYLINILLWKDPRYMKRSVVQFNRPQFIKRHHFQYASSSETQEPSETESLSPLRYATTDRYQKYRKSFAIPSEGKPHCFYDGDLVYTSDGASYRRVSCHPDPGRYHGSPIPIRRERYTVLTETGSLSSRRSSFNTVPLTKA